MIAHVAGGGILSDLVVPAVLLLIVGLVVVGESRRVAVACLAGAVVLGGVGGFDVARSRSKSSQGVSLAVVSPRSGDTLPANKPIEVKVNVTGMRLTPVGLSVNHPGEGHLHTYVDGTLYAMWSQSGNDDLMTLTIGPHRVLIELTSNDHRALSPPVRATLDLVAA